MIEGVIIQPLKQIKDERGMVMHMLRCDSPLFNQFGEIYFSLIYPKSIKAWKKHLKMTQHFAVPIGKIKLVLYDNRVDSSTKNEVQEIEVGEDNYSLIKIPPLLWYGFTGISEKEALIANCPDLPHDPSESEKIEEQSHMIPYKWE